GGRAGQAGGDRLLRDLRPRNHADVDQAVRGHARAGANGGRLLRPGPGAALLRHAQAMTAVRSFVAVPLPSTVQQAVFGIAGELAGALPGVRWSRKVENMHITMKFLGNVDEARLAAFGADLQAALVAVPAFPIAVRGV